MKRTPITPRMRRWAAAALTGAMLLGMVPAAAAAELGSDAADLLRQDGPAEESLLLETPAPEEWRPERTAPAWRTM